MTNLFTLRALAPFAMVAMVAACSNGDKDGTTDATDTDVDTVSTGDTSVTDDGFFNAASASIQFDLAYNADHELSSFFFDGTEAFPSMTVTLTDASQTDCVLLYQLDIDAFNAYLEATAATDTDAAEPSAAAANYLSWLDTQGLIAGQVIADGLYTGLISQDCLLDPAEWTEDPHSAFLGGAWQMGWTDGIPDSVQDVLDDNGGIEAVFGAGFDEGQAIGGYVRVPDGFFGPGSQRDLEALGLAGSVDESMEVQSDVDGNLVLIDAQDLASGAGPAPSYVRMFSMFGITFGG